MTTIGTPLAWLCFLAFMVAMLLLDLLVVHRKSREVSIREAALWSGVWMALALVFAGGTAVFAGPSRAAAFLGGWAIEKALSVDNLFVFLVLFQAFRVDKQYRHRVLFWGIFGALAMRGGFIAAGCVALEKLRWAMYVFGVLLVVIGAHMLVPQKADAGAPGQEDGDRAKAVAGWFRARVRTTRGYRGGRFFVRENGRLFATPLLAVLVAVELSDVVFAVDSVPAVLGVARDPFIVFTSNAFAILGLRSLFFVLAGLMDRFRNLRIALAVILVFVGTKMVFERHWHVPMGQSLVVIAFVLFAFVVGSVVAARRPRLRW